MRDITDRQYGSCLLKGKYNDGCTSAARSKKAAGRTTKTSDNLRRTSASTMGPTTYGPTTTTTDGRATTGTGEHDVGVSNSENCIANASDDEDDETRITPTASTQEHQ